MENNFIKLIETVKRGEAIIWEYSVSHGRLVLRINSLDLSKSIEIICLECEWISGKFRWSDCILEISEMDYLNSYGVKVRYSIKDRKNKFELHCVDLDIRKS
jgi:hypothetical protein